MQHASHPTSSQSAVNDLSGYVDLLTVSQFQMAWCIHSIVRECNRESLGEDIPDRLIGKHDSPAKTSDGHIHQLSTSRHRLVVGGGLAGCNLKERTSASRSQEGSTAYFSALNVPFCMADSFLAHSCSGRAIWLGVTHSSSGTFVLLFCQRVSS